MAATPESEKPGTNAPMESRPCFNPDRQRAKSPSPAAVRARMERLAGFDREAATTVVIHYHRTDQDYAGWQTWVWPEAPTRADGRFHPVIGSARPNAPPPPYIP